jgi:hypothetical protein
MSSVIDMSKTTERKELAPASETSALLQVIERAARDPNVDIVKMKELFAMRKEIAMEAAQATFNAAMNACQADTRPIATDATNPQTRSKYASYAQLDRALRPIYTKHGFSISFDEGDSPKTEHVRVLAYVAHSGGFTRTYRTDMPADGKGAKGGDVMTKTHAAGSAKSYGKRYILKDVFNIAVGEDDTDGNDDDYPRITERQAADLKALITEYGGDINKLLRYFKVGSLAEIHANNFEWTVGEVKRLAKAASEARSK